MTDVTEMKQAGKGTINADSARLRGERAKGAALANLVVRDATQERDAQLARGKQRMKFVADLAFLTPAGHAEFRSELKMELEIIRSAEESAEVKPSTVQGYSLNSFVVMVSCYRSLSQAFEAGYSPFNKEGAIEQTWDELLTATRAFRAAKTANGESIQVEGQRKQGAGRKAANPVDKVIASIGKLDRRQQRRVLEQLATSFGVVITWPASAKAKLASQEAPANV